MAEVDLDEYNGDQLVAVTIALLALSWIAVSLRTYTRAIILGGFQVDDWLMIAAQAVFTATCAFILAGVCKGIGRHNTAITTDNDRVSALMWQAIATITYLLTMLFVKLSIGVFLLRLSVDGKYRTVIKFSLLVVILYTTGVLFWDIFQCTPVSKQWDYRIAGGNCASGQDIINAAYAISAFTIVSDWFYALLPIPMLWRVKMTNQAKFTVALILGLGIFASTATLIRIKFLASLIETDDLLLSATQTLVWSMVECGVAIIASSLATVRPLLRVFRFRDIELSTHAPSIALPGKKRQRSISRPKNNDISLLQVTVVNSESWSEALSSDEYHRHITDYSTHPPWLPYHPGPMLGNNVCISVGNFLDSFETDGTTRGDSHEGKQASSQT